MNPPSSPSQFAKMLKIDTIPTIPHFGGMKWAEISSILEKHEKSQKKPKVRFSKL